MTSVVLEVLNCKLAWNAVLKEVCKENIHNRKQ